MERVKQIGRHRVQCGDLMDGIDDLMGGEKANCFYSDPPWGQGNLSYWQTMNSKMTGAQSKWIDFKGFLTQVFSLATRYTTGPIIIEYGKRWCNEVIVEGAKFGLRHLDVGEALYKSGSRLLPLDVHLFIKEGQVLPLVTGGRYFSDIDGTHGIATLRAALGQFALPGLKILDPSCGVGLTAKIALETGMTFYGNEINEARLGYTIRLLEKSVEVAYD